MHDSQVAKTVKMHIFTTRVELRFQIPTLQDMLSAVAILLSSFFLLYQGGIRGQPSRALAEDPHPAEGLLGSMNH